MGDKRRFDLFADLILKQFPKARDFSIADVAGGKGFLRAALTERHVQNVTTWDKCPSMPQKAGYKRSLFNFKTAPDEYDLVVGMHPDQGTDHIVLYGVTWRVPFIVCPCCVLPSASVFSGKRAYDAWCKHLAGLAKANGMRVEEFDLRMRGCSTVLVGRPVS